MKQFAPCPKCLNNSAEAVKFSWWGGLIGPRIINHVKCKACGATFNGKTGKDNTNNIIIYFVVLGLIIVGFTALMIIPALLSSAF